MIKQTLTLAAQSGAGETTREFQFKNLTPGLYDLQIVKAGHLPITVTGIPANDSVNLTHLLSRTPMIAGDINGDEVVDLQDLITLTAESNFNKGKTVIPYTP